MQMKSCYLIRLDEEEEEKAFGMLMNEKTSINQTDSIRTSSSSSNSKMTNN